MREPFIAIRPLSVPNRLFLAIAVSVGGWSNGLEAAQFDYQLGYRGEYSDNVTRIPNEREGRSELINTATTAFSFLENTSTLIARVLGSAAYNHYYNNSYENYTALSLDAYAEVYMAERTLSWVAADGFRRLQIDPLSPDIPTNRQNSNAWATGPNIYLRPSSVDTITFEARYGRSWVDTLEIDNDRQSYAARWGHRTSNRTTWFLNYEYTELDFENDTLNTDLSKHSYFLRADIHDARTRFTADLGRTRIDREGFESAAEWLARVSLSMSVGGLADAGLHYRREYADTGGELLPSAQPTPSPATGAGSAMPTLGVDVVTSEPYYLEQADLFYMSRGTTLPWAGQLFYRDTDYPVSPLDRTEKGASVNLEYRYSSSSSIRIHSMYNILDYAQLMREDRESTIGVSLVYRMTPNLQTSVGFNRFGRNSTAPNQDYTDNRAALTFTYGSRSAGH